jgi:hypothetical protein
MINWRKTLGVIAAILLGVVPINSQLLITFVGGSSNSSGGTCAASTAYLAAVSGLSGTQISAYNTAICALVSAGLFNTRFDAWYFFANASAANARVNVIAPGTYNLTEHGTCTFTANTGIQGDSATCYEDPAFVPSTAAGHFALNSSSFGVCILNSRTTVTGNPGTIGGLGSVANSYDYLAVLNDNPTKTTAGSMSEAALSSAIAPTVANAQGMTVITRPDSGQYFFYLNGALLANIIHASIALANTTSVIFAFNNNGTIGFFSPDQLAYAWIGASVSLAETQTIRSIMNTMLATLGAPNVC